MALNTLIRTASRVVPLAIRASAGTQCYFHRHYCSAFSAAVNGRVSRSPLRRSFPSFLHQYSTETSSDESILQVIEIEISCAKTSLVDCEDEPVPEGFPFKVEDNLGMQTIKLTREYQGETISVEVYMPDLITGGYEEGEERANQSSLPLLVKTSKKSGPYLEFGCTAYPDEIVIDSLSVKDPENTEEQIAYEGPDFADLDENLQKSLHRYLEIRGIKPSTTNFLHGYMINKDTKEYLEWLQKIQKFLRA